jgi:hypothetical protein
MNEATPSEIAAIIQKSTFKKLVIYRDVLIRGLYVRVPSETTETYFAKYWGGFIPIVHTENEMLEYQPQEGKEFKAIQNYDGSWIEDSLNVNYSLNYIRGCDKSIFYLNQHK